jgi:uncharacterized protein (DUF2252 family)
LLRRTRTVGREKSQKFTDEEAVLHDATFSPKDNRRERGKILADSFPHKLHAGWKAPSSRPDPIDILEKSNDGRIKDLIPLRYGRMMQSPFTFFRGAAALMAMDLGELKGLPKVNVQACGDCHLLNFGAFATPERNILFDINDFDETLPAPWEWDLKRLAVSFVLAARENGLKAKYASEAAETVARAYREKIEELSHMSILDIWYEKVDWQSVIASTSDGDLQKRRKEKLKREMKRNMDYYFPKFAEESGGKFRFKDTPPTMYHPAGAEGKKLDEKIRKALELYKESLQEHTRRLVNRYKVEDVAIKVVGIGSVGTLCAVALLLASENEPLILQIKEARHSVLAPYVGKSTFENQGQRVVEGQRIIQSASDMFLGWTESESGKHFYVRQLRDTKVKPEPELWDGPQMIEIAEVMGRVLARAHARSGDAAVISGYLGAGETFDSAITDFALNYADQTERDHALLLAAIKSGRLKAEIEPEDD